MADEQDLNEWMTNIGNILLDKSGKNVCDKALSQNVIALYFGGDWSPPCMEYCKQLKESYNNLSERLAPFRIVYAPCDKTEDEYEKSVNGLHENWFRLPLNNPIIEQMINKYEIMAIPKLIIVKEDGELITSKGRKELQDKGTSAFRNWANASNLADWERIALKQKTSDAKRVLQSLHALKIRNSIANQ